MAHKKGSALSKAVSKQKPVPVKIVSDSPKSYPEEDNNWRRESDLRILQEAEKIRQDKERFKGAKECAKEQLKTLSKIK